MEKQQHLALIDCMSTVITQSCLCQVKKSTQCHAGKESLPEQRERTVNCLISLACCSKVNHRAKSMSKFSLP